MPQDYRKYKYPARNLFVALGLIPVEDHRVDLARILNIKSDTIGEWMSKSLTETQADKYACRAGLHPGAVWPNDEDYFYTKQLIDEAYARKIQRSKEDRRRSRERTKKLIDA
jgi:hypothetical protein